VSVLGKKYKHDIPIKSIMKINLKTLFIALFIMLPLIVFRGSCQADSFTDNLTNGYSSGYWVLYTNTALFTISTNGGDVVFSKAEGIVNSTIQYATLVSLLAARGGFDVSIDFTNASVGLVSGTIGNQIQLNTRFGGQDFLMVRSDESSFGQNAHVFPNPPGTVGMGVISWTTNFGTLRVVRTNTLVQGYIDSTLIYQNTYNTNDATFSFVLQNNHTSDAVSVGFRKFRLTADQIVPLPRQLNAQLFRSGNLVVSWEDTSWPDFLSGYTLLSSTNLGGTNSWQALVSDPVATENQFLITNIVSLTPEFFRFRQGP
jgi:hypothetical protein